MTNYEQARQISVTMLSNNIEGINTEQIRKTIQRVNVLFELSEQEQERLLTDLEEQYAIFSDEYRILDDQKPEPWVKSAKAEISWKFWNRYRILLEQKNYAPDTINKLDDLTDDLLDRLIRPGSAGPFDKRGLIVGHVQSGKTGNYIGLIAKAADAGYKLIIVLAGIHNSLRSQTQLRIDEGFLGFDTQQARSFTQTNNRIGVGKIDPRLAAHSLTTNEINGDFNRRASESSGINIRGNDPIILVIKKNVSVMKNLLSWLLSRGETMTDGKKQIKALPLLVIDDEADNASINISSNQVSGTNACIRSLLKLFDQSAYVGYTATPYANIFIPQQKDDKPEPKGIDYSINNMPVSLGEDIFPRNFIVNIPAPSNYIGPEKIFGISSIDNLSSEVHPVNIFSVVDDYEQDIPDGHKKGDDRPDDLPESLKKAIKCFFLSCAARRVRGQESAHNSMLVHVTRFISWQDRIATLVLNEVKMYSRQIEFSIPNFMREMEDLWNQEYEPTTRAIIDNPSVHDPAIQEISWQQVAEQLHPAAAKIEVRAVHGDKKIEQLEHKNIRPLDYYDSPSGLSVIAVGGNKLSRGLTLEGLTISYFLRGSKMYDTLMQMGRWFGYRPGYLDLCRLFTSEEIIRWYLHINLATNELRAEFDRMADLDKTPADFGLKVRTHEGGLVITAANKFRYKKIMELSFSGKLEETYTFKKIDPESLHNYNHALTFISGLGHPQGAPNSDPALRNHFVWRGTNNADRVIAFLQGYKSIQPSFNVAMMSEYIQAQQQTGMIRNWTIALINNTQDPDKLQIGSEVRVGLTKRTDASKFRQYYMINKSHIIDPKHEYIDLSDEQIEVALAETVKNSWKQKTEKEVKVPNTFSIKSARYNSDALLLIYLLNPRPDPEKPAVSDVPMVGLALSFPEIKKDRTIFYAVNQQFLEEFNYADELDNELIEDENQNDSTKNSEGDGSEMTEFLLRHIASVSAYNKKNSFVFEPGTELVYASSKEHAGADKAIVPLYSGESYPAMRSEDVEKYYVNEHNGFWAVNAGNERLDAGSLVAPAIYQQPAFTIIGHDAVIHNSLISIKSELNAEYLLAMFNSSLFSFFSIGRRGQPTEQVIDAFPLISSANKSTGIIALVKTLLYLEQDRSSRESRVISAFFINVLDAAVFELYFPEKFLNTKLSVLAALAAFTPVEAEQETPATYFSILNDPAGPVKKAVYTINTIPEFRHIYQTLSNEDKKDNH